MKFKRLWWLGVSQTHVVQEKSTREGPKSRGNEQA